MRVLRVPKVLQAQSWNRAGLSCFLFTLFPQQGLPRGEFLEVLSPFPPTLVHLLLHGPFHLVIFHLWKKIRMYFRTFSVWLYQCVSITYHMWNRPHVVSKDRVMVPLKVALQEWVVGYWLNMGLPCCLIHVSLQPMKSTRTGSSGCVTLSLCALSPCWTRASGTAVAWGMCCEDHRKM